MTAGKEISRGNGGSEITKLGERAQAGARRNMRTRLPKLKREGYHRPCLHDRAVIGKVCTACSTSGGVIAGFHVDQADRAGTESAAGIEGMDNGRIRCLLLQMLLVSEEQVVRDGLERVLHLVSDTAAAINPVVSFPLQAIAQKSAAFRQWMLSGSSTLRGGSPLLAAKELRGQPW